ncbi:DUF3035 domain-containing protein [Limibaculum sp. FT325]|uniref:DUF3035 domain-containing protein n=1 Tax=Thermohalobaculum sediminis TaxID=2939436 RepID=UPI0020BF006C|nr:DUF3035 domain-containing protein [Limibaculum sediminis]MCL5779143.1 DUF3035 domain-containing protein [Limibaculum sediminis]
MSNRRRPPLGTAALAAVLALAGCSQMGDPIEAIGARRPAPDEFKVLPRKPLMVEPALASGALPAPEPGKPSPLEPDPAADAVAALMGTEATPRPMGTASLSAGESALLGAADAAAASPDIRGQLESDRSAASQADANKPYEPPTLLELVGLGGNEEEELDPAVALDAIGESQRLQREGIAAPSDPRATAATDGEGGELFSTGAPTEDPSTYSDTLGRRPPSPLTGRTEPAFD